MRTPRKDKCPATLAMINNCTKQGDWSCEHPTDVPEFRLCRLLLEQQPELRPMLASKLGTKSKEWAELISFWDDLCLIHDLECPNWREKPGSGRNTRSMLEELLVRANPTNAKDYL